MRPEVTAAFAMLEAHRAGLGQQRILELFNEDTQRFEKFSARLDDILFDYSKHKINETTLARLLDLARAADVEGQRAALFSGAHVNNTEDRAVQHMALRDMSGSPAIIDGHNFTGDIGRVRKAFLNFATQVREGTIRGARNAPFADVVNIGIGGSDLGPAMAARALSPFRGSGPRVHFVSNVDGADLADTLKTLNPATTLFIISSKIFTTQETMKNAQSARLSIIKQLGEMAIGDHFAAVSTKLDLVVKFGIRNDRVFGFWDWVGGRYSIWSSIGLSLAIAIGASKFNEFLRGAHDVDKHFVDTPLEKNIPVLMALLGVWYRNVCGCTSQAVIPYDQRLARFPAYLQQLDMESNGKSVTREGAAVTMASAPVIWGEPGANGQHAFFQMLHQGSDIIPVDFIAAAQPSDADAGHHALLLANCFAQSEALMRGRSRQEVEDILRQQAMPEERIAELAPHKVFAGDRPSSTILYRKLDARTLGRLIALYEHKVFVQSAIWNINAFDQWGVELGKELCSRLAPIVEDTTSPLDGLDGSTAGLIAARRALL